MILQNHQIIAIDCDEVICDFSRYMLEKFDIKKSDGTKLFLSDLQEYNFSLNSGVTHTNEEFIEMFIKTSIEDKEILEIPLMNGSQEVLQQLKNDGKELHLVTARQSFLEDYTKNWVEKYFPDIFTDFHFCNHEGGGSFINKSDVCKQIGATLIIDDSPTNTQDCAERGIDVILFEMPWNKKEKFEYDNVFRIESWEELKKELDGTEPILVK